MIVPDAKCVVNGPKVNEVINVLNNILNVAVSEEFEVVEYGNVPGRRWFLTGKLTDQKQDSAGGGRDKLNEGAGSGSNNRDNLNPGIDGGGGALKDDGGVNPPIIDGGGGGGALKDDGTTTRGGTSFTPGTGRTGTTGGGQTDEFGNVIGGTGGALLDDGTTTRGVPLTPTGDTGGALLDDGTTTRDTTPPPLVGAPPLESDTPPPSIPLEDTTPTADTSEPLDFSPGSRDLRQLQIHNPEEFARIAAEDFKARWNNLEQLQTYFNQQGESLRKYNNDLYQAIIRRMAELSREAEGNSRGTR